MFGRFEPEVALLVTVLSFAIIARIFFPRLKEHKTEGTIRVCVSCTPKTDLYELMTRFLSTSCRLYDVSFGIMIECSEMTDALSNEPDNCPHELRDRVRIHHTVSIPKENHEKRHRRLFKKFSNGMEDLIVLADPRVVPEFRWDENLMLAFHKNEKVVVTCPLCPHSSGFPTLRERSNGDIVRDVAKAFLNEDSTFVSSVCLCHEFVAFSPNHFFLDEKTMDVVSPPFVS